MMDPLVTLIPQLENFAECHHGRVRSADADGDGHKISQRRSMRSQKLDHERCTLHTESARHISAFLPGRGCKPLQPAVDAPRAPLAGAWKLFEVS